MKEVGQLEFRFQPDPFERDTLLGRHLSADALDLRRFILAGAGHHRLPIQTTGIVPYAGYFYAGNGEQVRNRHRQCGDADNSCDQIVKVWLQPSLTRIWLAILSTTSPAQCTSWHPLGRVFSLTPGVQYGAKAP